MFSNEQYTPGKQATQRAKNTVDDLRYGGLDWASRGPLDTSMIFNRDLKNPNLAFSKTNKTYSGTDCTVIVVYNQYLLILGNLQTFSYSIFREKTHIRTLGRVLSKNSTYGTKTIAGSMIFVEFDEHPLYPLFQFFDKRTETIHRYSSPLSDDIPPFDMMLIFNNEYGAQSIIRLYHVELFQEGAVYSINDMYSENTIQFTAKDMDSMVSAGEEGSWKQLLFKKMTEGKVIDAMFESMIKQRQRLEFQASKLMIEINRLEEASARKIRPLRVAGEGEELNRVQTRINNRRQERANNRKQLEVKKKQLNNINAELEVLDNSIRNYERTRMAWDMNSGLTKTNTSTSIFNNTTDRT